MPCPNCNEPAPGERPTDANRLCAALRFGQRLGPSSRAMPPCRFPRTRPTPSWIGGASSSTMLMGRRSLTSISRMSPVGGRRPGRHILANLRCRTRLAGFMVSLSPDPSVPGRGFFLSIVGAFRRKVVNSCRGSMSRRKTSGYARGDLSNAPQPSKLPGSLLISGLRRT
jgi:hypothetical protein